MALSMSQYTGGAWTAVDMAAQRICNIRLSVGYSHPATLEFTVLQGQHQKPIADRTPIRFHDSDYAAGHATNNPVFEGHVYQINPGAVANEVNYVCYDATQRAAHEVFVMSAAYTEGPVEGTATYPRLVYNSKIDTDDDAAFQRAADATVETILTNLFDDAYWALEPHLAAPDSTSPGVPGGTAYTAADLTGFTFKSQEKIVFESETLRSAIDRVLQLYPQYRIVFHPGDSHRKWRFVNVKNSSAVTVTLNKWPDANNRYCLSMSLTRSLERRYTAVKIYGPEKTTLGDFYVSAGTLTENWTSIAESSAEYGGPDSESPVAREWQITDATKRRLMRYLPTDVYVPALGLKIGTHVTGILFQLTRNPTLLVRWGTGDWLPVDGIELDLQNGKVRSPIQLFSTVTGVYKAPDDTRFIVGYLGVPDTSRYPTSSYSGTAFTVASLQAEMKQYDEAVAIGYENGTPVTSAVRLAEFDKLAQSIQEAVRDIVYTGGFTCKGLDYEWIRLDRRVNFAAVDQDGAALTTNWEAINAIVTDVEYDYENMVTTVTLSSDHMEFSLTDPDQLKQLLKIEAMRQIRTQTYKWVFVRGGPLGRRAELRMTESYEYIPESEAQRRDALPPEPFISAVQGEVVGPPPGPIVSPPINPTRPPIVNPQPRIAQPGNLPRQPRPVNPIPDAIFPESEPLPPEATEPGVV